MNVVDHTSHEKFYEYYAQASQSPDALVRFRTVRDSILRYRSNYGWPNRKLDVADIGCGAGTQSLVWAELGHRVHGLDVNQPLLELAEKRATAENVNIDFKLGSSSKMPWANESMDVCVVLELLEHVSEWQACVEECSRILRPDGILFLTTTNKLCPFQNEYNLPLYSWYPGKLKRYFERLAVTKRPEIANYATYPAVNWFTFYSLSDSLSRYGFTSKDRFDIKDLSQADRLTRFILAAVQKSALLRFLAHIGTQGTIVFAVKSGA